MEEVKMKSEAFVAIVNDLQKGIGGGGGEGKAA